MTAAAQRLVDGASAVAQAHVYLPKPFQISDLTRRGRAARERVRLVYQLSVA